MDQHCIPTDWGQWVDELAKALHARNRWRLSLLILGIFLASGRRTVTSWLRAAGVSDDFAIYYYFLQPIGRRAQQIAERLLSLLLEHLVTDDRVLFVISLVLHHPLWDAIGLPLIGLLYVRAQDIEKIPTESFMV
jgi:hypothetical protein